MAPTGVEETGQGTGEYKVKAAGLKTPVDHLFHSGTAAAVAYDVSRILAMKTGFLKPEPKKGFNLNPASEEFLEHLVDTQTVKDRDQILLVVKHVGRMLDVFLERHEQAPLFPAQEEDYDQKVKFCFRDSGDFRQMSIDQVPGLQNIKEYHDSGKLFIPGRRGRPPLKRVQEGQPDTDTKTNASASLRASATPARGKSARGRKKQGEVVTADEEAFSGHLPPPQTQADVAAAVAEAASGDLTQGEVAAPVTEADVAAAVAEPASGVLSLPQTEGDVQYVAESGLGRGRGRGRGRPRGSGRGKSQGRGSGSGKDTGNFPPPQTQGEVVTADEEAFSGHLPPPQTQGKIAAPVAEAFSGHVPQTQADVAAAVAEPASGDLTQGEVAAPVAEAFSDQLPPQPQADVAAAVAEPASGVLPLPQTEGDVQSVAEHGLGRGRGRPRGSGRGKSQGRDTGKDTGRSESEGQGQTGRRARTPGRGRPPGRGRTPGRGRPPGRGLTPGRGRIPGRGRGRRPTNPDMNVGEAGGLDALSIPESPAAQPPPSPSSGAEENEVPELRNVRKRKRKRDNTGKAIAATATSTKPIVSGGPYLILDVETQCATHGVRTSTHYHFAHDCVCVAVNDVVECCVYLNQHPLKRAQFSENELPPCFQQWRNTHRQFFERRP